MTQDDICTVETPKAVVENLRPSRESYRVLKSHVTRQRKRYELLASLVGEYLSQLYMRNQMIAESVEHPEDHSPEMCARWDAILDECNENIHCFREQLAKLIGWEPPPDDPAVGIKEEDDGKA